MELQNLIDQYGFGIDPQEMEMIKSLSTASGFYGINLEPVVKLMLPVLNPLRRRIPADRPAMGSTAVRFKVQLGFGDQDFSAFGVAEAGVGSDTTAGAVEVVIPYKFQAVKGSVTFQSIFTARGFDDPLAAETARRLAALIRLEELMLLGGNAAALPAPASVTVAGGGSGSTFGVGVWNVKVTALTLRGVIANTSAPSATYVGESAPASGSVNLASAAAYLDISWPAVPGALAYKVYVSNAAGGSTTYLVRPQDVLDKDGSSIPYLTGSAPVHYVTVNRIRVTAPPPTSQPVAPTGDNSADSLAYEGIVAWASKSSIYGLTVSDKMVMDLGGAPLTAAAGSIKEFDQVLAFLWTRWQISPTLILCDALTAGAITSTLINVPNVPLYRVEIGPERGAFVGGAYVGGYVNKFAAGQIPGALAVVPVWAHPYMPPSTILFLTERIPYQYAREARGFALDVLYPYTFFRLYPNNSLELPFSITLGQALKCYHPPAQAAILGAKVW